MRYYGNKTKLLDFISTTAEPLIKSKNKVFFDLFSGTTVVGQHFKRLDYQVISNDWLFFSYVLATATIGINIQPTFSKVFKFLNTSDHIDIIDYMNDINPKADFITKNYTPFGKNERQYFSTENGKKIDAIRLKIEEWKQLSLLNNDEYCYLIASLLYAVNKVSNVSGTYGSFLKTWDKRSFKPLKLEHLSLTTNNKENHCYNENSELLIQRIECDILYLDPPYNSRQYASNYFLLELIAEGWFGKEPPQIYGHTGMRPYDHQKSSFAMKKEASVALERIIKYANAKFILLSYNNEGIISPDKLHEVLSTRGEVTVHTYDHKRYRSVGQDGSNSKTVEFLYVLKIRN